MQLILRGGGTKTLSVDTNVPRTMPLTKPVIATGIQTVSGQIYVPPDVPATFRAELIHRYWLTDEPTSAQPWASLTGGTAVVQVGPGKLYVRGTPVTPAPGLFVQLGLRLDDTTATSWGRALLQYPSIVVT